MIYNIVDDWGDVYNLEPFTSFIQAQAYKDYYIGRGVNRITELHIKATIVPGFENLKSVVVKKPEPKRIAYAESEF